MDAIDGALLLHVPPPEELLSVVVDPIHNAEAPVIAPTEVFTLIDVVLVPHEVV